MKLNVHFLLLIALIIFTNTTAFAGPTMVSGNVSGTWDLAGSPFIVQNDCTIQKGETLTINPGVEVILGSNLSINVYGQILANGSKSAPITFKAPNEDIKWRQIYIYGYENGSPFSEFRYCNFRNAETAISLYVQGHDQNVVTIMEISISNCVFYDSVNNAIYGEAYGYARTMQHDYWSSSLNPSIKNSVFRTANNGLELYAHGSCSAWCAGAFSSPIVENSVFDNLSGVAIRMTPASMNGGSPLFLNNTIMNCNIGIETHNNLDATIYNNIFYNNTLGITKTGTLSNSVSYNSFFGNITDFEGYPSSFGEIVYTNTNGDPCDIGFNIFLDPMLVENDFHITEDSPCIDAGTSDDAPDIDIDGDSRPQLYAIDIGADEFYKKELFAKAGPDLTVCTLLCDEVTFNGSKSYALSSTINFYDWTLLHRTDSMYDQTATGSTPLITNLGLGIYDVTLTVTDDGGIQATDLMVLTVKNDCDPCSVMKGDLDSDGDVDGDDLTIFSHYFGTTPAVSEDK